MDRNFHQTRNVVDTAMSLSARRAWIEMVIAAVFSLTTVVALRKESVDRN